jgi:hypothetical protein
MAKAMVLVRKNNYIETNSRISVSGNPTILNKTRGFPSLLFNRFGFIGFPIADES